MKHLGDLLAGTTIAGTLLIVATGTYPLAWATVLTGVAALATYWADDRRRMR